MLDGGAGIDRLHGGSGDDNLTVDRADLVRGIVDGGNGTDLLIVGDSAGVIVDLVDREVEAVFGGSGNDTFFGTAGNDLLRGGDGAERIEGGAGSDDADYRDQTARIDLEATVQDGAGPCRSPAGSRSARPARASTATHARAVRV